MTDTEVPGLLDYIAAKSIHPRPDCMIFTGTLKRGYGRLRIKGKDMLAHRAAWEAVHGPIPGDLTIDHLCRVRGCVNVEHMELVTLAENARRGNEARRAQPKVRLSIVSPHRTPRPPKPIPTHCPEGHEYTPENSYVSPSENRPRCRICRAAKEKKRPPRDWSKYSRAKSLSTR